MKSANLYLSFNQCPEHTRYKSICIEYEDGSGTRLTSSKCCGHWKRVWRMRVDAPRVAAEIITAAWETSTQEQRFALEKHLRDLTAVHALPEL